jgi:hypothetical protein
MNVSSNMAGRFVSARAFAGHGEHALGCAEIAGVDSLGAVTLYEEGESTHGWS